MKRIVFAASVVMSWLTGAVAVQAQDHGSLIFEDDFDAGIKRDWVMEGDNFGMVNGQLNSLGRLTAYVGDVNWDNYAVEFDLVDMAYPSDLSILVRRRGRRD